MLHALSDWAFDIFSHQRSGVSRSVDEQGSTVANRRPDPAEQPVKAREAPAEDDDQSFLWAFYPIY